MAKYMESYMTMYDVRATVANPTNVEKNSDKIKPHHNHDQKHNSDTKNSLSEIAEIADEGWEYENTSIVDTRRILYSKMVAIGKRPYMVYLQLTKESAKAHKYRGWLCGGVIVDASYVLTSAACVEDADHFYIVSGTTQFVDSFDYKENDCICKHRRKVVWKCIPKNYKFDFQDSIKWSSNDIAIVKVDKPFKLGVVEKGCEFATDLICYNNISRELEKPGTKGYIAGWGSGSNFREGVYRRQEVHIPQNAKGLQEAKVCIMDNEQCAKKWAQKFRNIITQYMICTKDIMRRLSEICDKKYANCTDVESRRHDIEDSADTSQTNSVDLGRHLRDPDDYTARRSSMQGGFCENDHGGPLIVKYQGKERVIGVISACKIDPKSHSCHGPFLYTSVYKNRQFISCAIHKDVEDNCRRVFRTGITHEEWSVNWDNVEEDDTQQEKGESIEKRIEIKKEDKQNPDSSESESEEVTQGNIDKVEKKKDKKVSSKHANRSSKKSYGKKHGTAKKVEKKKSKKSKHSEDGHAKGEDKEVFYESSKDENVNEPDDA
ncbi:uncharacterized protein LOC131845434 [Achroia grisella]|uniref:uncharacterized protein LOC131845434 n=1 Tax=Achroia grisella TaxID=688607 RepID=UPI0027D20665|nr:uncharacterized protein LOC131845434 [Achroia grisella]